jgi:dihydrofolate reductase
VVKALRASTLRSADWNNSEIISGDVVAETTRLKQDSTGDLVMYGCGRLGQTLLEHDLVDVLNLWIHPVILGTGESLLHEGQRKELQLDSVERRSSGVVSLTYVRKE